MSEHPEMVDPGAEYGPDDPAGIAAVDQERAECLTRIGAAKTAFVVTLSEGNTFQAGGFADSSDHYERFLRDTLYVVQDMLKAGGFE